MSNKHSKKTSPEVIQTFEEEVAILTSESTEATFELPISAEVPTCVASIDHLINVHLSESGKQLVGDTITKFPHKLDKILLYVNRLPESQLSTVFSFSTF